MGLSEQESPWLALRARQFRRGSREADVLFAFFGEAPTNEQADRRANATTISTARYPLFKHQILAAESVGNVLIDRARPRVLLHMPTGAGKTRTAMNIVADRIRRLGEYGTVVLWLAHSEELCEQAAEEFTEAWSFLGNRPIPTVRFYGIYSGNLDLSDITEGFVVCSLQLLYSRSKSEQRWCISFLERKASRNLLDL